ncbi:MAG: hypothetical protein CBB71_21175 [Rhodopirellula sp. TMED11]|nr:MAG: hypothetical protein CBB71_21175 [Rhodopirellula sp. TMED11]
MTKIAAHWPEKPIVLAAKCLRLKPARQPDGVDHVIRRQAAFEWTVVLTRVASPNRQVLVGELAGCVADWGLFWPA